MEEETRVIEPILQTGSYGVHIIKAPSDRYIFVGTVPVSLVNNSYDTYKQAETGFISWFKNLPVTEQRSMAGNLRNDIFIKVME